MQKAKVIKSALPKCVLCTKPVSKEFFPFCSQHCRSVDLHRWLAGSYVLPGPSIDEESD